VFAVPAKVMLGFKESEGKEIVVDLVSGRQRLRIKAAWPTKVQASKVLVANGRKVGSSPRSFGYNDLSVREKLMRLGKDQTPASNIVCGLLAYEAKRDEYMKKYFEKADCPLSNLLTIRAQELNKQKTAEAEEQRKAAFESAAKQAFLQLLQTAEIRPDMSDPERLVDVVRKKTWPELQVTRIKQALTRFENEYKESAVAGKNKRLINVLAAIRPGMPLYVDRATVEKVVTELNKLNPRCGVKIDHFEITDDGVSANLAGLGNLADIAPLSSLPIVAIDLTNSQVKDVTPLANAPLRDIRTWHPWYEIHLSRLSVLKQCPIKNFYYLGKVADNIEWMQVFNLKRVDISSKSMKIEDLEPFGNSDLAHLSIKQGAGDHPFRISDLSVLKNMPLTHLSLIPGVKSSVKDLSPLQGAPLAHLELPRSKVESLDHLKGMPLEYLDISGTNVSDLSPLKGMPLKHLKIADTKVKDVGPLINCPLESLDIRNVPVGNISVLDRISTLKKIYR